MISICWCGAESTLCIEMGAGGMGITLAIDTDRRLKIFSTSFELLYLNRLRVFSRERWKFCLGDEVE